MAAHRAPSPPQIPASASREQRSGTQAIERAALILRELSTRGRFGWRLSDLAARCQLDRGTTHRILRALQRERLVSQRADDRHYLPGPLLFEMGQAMPAYTAFQNACAPALRRLARRFGSLALAQLHSDVDTVCVGRAGESVYIGTAMDLGTRWPLIASAGGVAILIGLAAAERERIKRDNFARMASRSPPAMRAIEAMIARSEALGFAYNRSETAPGVHAFGVALGRVGSQPFGSLALACRAEDVTRERIGEILQALREEAHLLDPAARLAVG